MKTIPENDKRTLFARVKRKRGSGAIALTNPERRILKADRSLAAGFNWAAAVWDAATMEISALFDAADAALSTPGKYFMQLRGVIGPERYTKEIAVTVTEIGP